MKKYIILFSLFCYLLYSNIIVIRANDDINLTSSEIFEEMPVVYESDYYASPRSATLTLGSLGLTTSGGLAVLGGLASTVAPILGAVALLS